jgi:hypothetical protein
VYPSVTAAPLVIVPMSCKRTYLDRYAEPDKGWTDRDESRWPVPFRHIDTGMAALLILLTAVGEGLGALYFGIVPEAVGPFRAAFGVPEDHGLSAPSPSATARRRCRGTCAPAAACPEKSSITGTGRGPLGEADDEDASRSLARVSGVPWLAVMVASAVGVPSAGTRWPAAPGCRLPRPRDRIVVALSRL